MSIVLITGVGQGIGRALAEKFLAEGWTVFGTTTSGQADFAHERLRIFQLDLADPASIAACAGAVQATGEKIEILINNAATLADEEETSVVVEKLRQTLEVNLIGTVDLTERLLPLVSPGGHVVNISSAAGSLANVGQSHSVGHYPAYKIAKAALNMYTRTLALHWQGQLTVSAVHPGWVRTAIGGDEADLSPEEAAVDLFKLATSRPESGQFWFRGEKFPW